MGTRGTRPQKIGQKSDEPQLIVDVNDIITYARKNGFIVNYVTNVEGIINSTEGVDVEYIDNLPSSVSGKLEHKNNKWVVIVNKLHHPNRQRFTMAHELAHYYLHRDSSDKFADTTFFRDDAYTPIEYVANDFASQLLMPEDSVRQCIGSGITSLNQVAELFQVSVDAMRNRIKSLGYNTKPTEL